MKQHSIIRLIGTVFIGSLAGCGLQPQVRPEALPVREEIVADIAPSAALKNELAVGQVQFADGVNWTGVEITPKSVQDALEISLKQAGYSVQTPEKARYRMNVQLEDLRLDGMGWQADSVAKIRYTIVDARGKQRWRKTVTTAGSLTMAQESDGQERMLACIEKALQENITHVLRELELVKTQDLKQ